MCIIIDRPCGVDLEMTKLRSCSAINTDGFGVMYIDPSDGTLKTERYLPKNLIASQETFIERWEELKNVHAIYHLRFTTHGTTTMDNVHPFKVLDKATHGRDLYFMHNGCISITSSDPEDKDKSDTRLFGEYVLRPLLAEFPTALENLAVQSLIEDYIGSSKLIFLDSDGLVTRLGKWETNEGCVVSNNSYFSRYERTANSNAHKPWKGYGYDASTDVDMYSDEYWEKKYPYKPIDSTPTVLTPKAEEVDVKKVDDALARTAFLKDKARVIDRKIENDDGDYDMVMVYNTMKHIDYVTVDDLSALHEQGDLYDLCYEHPEKMAELLGALVDYTNVLDLEQKRGYAV